MLSLSADVQTTIRSERAAGIGPSESTDVEQIACSAVSTWRNIDAALAPVIGKRGVAALYQRSLYLARADHPWLSAVYERGLELGGFRPLQAGLALRTRSEAAATQGALLRAFAELLSTLIGRSLTDRLLNAAWSRPSLGESSP